MIGLRKLYRASRVKRYHTVDTLQEQTLAQHSWGVALIVNAITPREHPNRGRLLEYAMTHDLHEVASGDSPATAKWNSPELEEFHRREEQDFNRLHHLVQFDDLTHPEKQIVKWADMLELVLWCEKEMAMGNSYIGEVYRNGINWLESHNPPTSEARNLYEDLFG